MLKVHLPDGSVKEYSHRVRPLDIAAEIGPRLAKATLAAQVDGRLLGADSRCPKTAKSRFGCSRKKTPKPWTSCGIRAHVMARAVMRLFPGTQLAFGPTIDNGFYYDFQLEHKLSEEDFPKIEAEMAKIVKEDEPFERVELAHDEARQLFAELGQTLKVEHLEDGLKDEAQVSFYRQGEFIDLCRGPHIPEPGRDRRLQAALGGRRVLEGRRLEAAVAAALRHGLVQQAGLGRLSASGRRGQAPRPSRAGQAAWNCS